MTTMSSEARPRAGAAESRSIAYVPAAERHGAVWRQGTFFAASLHATDPLPGIHQAGDAASGGPGSVLTVLTALAPRE